MRQNIIKSKITRISKERGLKPCLCCIYLDRRMLFKELAELKEAEKEVEEIYGC